MAAFVSLSFTPVSLALSRPISLALHRPRRLRTAFRTQPASCATVSSLPLSVVPVASYDLFLRTRTYASPGPPPHPAAAVLLPPSACSSDTTAYLAALAAHRALHLHPPSPAPDQILIIDRTTLLGTVRLADILLSPQTPLIALMTPSPTTLPSTTCAALAITLAADPHPFLAVVDPSGSVVGAVAARDVARLVSAAPSPYFATSLGRLVSARAPWLIALLMLQSVSSFILGSFGGLIEKNVLLACFLTTVVGAGGNSGSQSSAMLIVGLARGDICERKDFWRVLGKEVAVALVLGVMLAGVVFVRVALSAKGKTDVVFLSAASIALAVMLTVVVASFLGSATPMLLKRVGVDPTVASGPALATLTDICGVLLLCFTASLLLGGAL